MTLAGGKSLARQRSATVRETGLVGGHMSPLCLWLRPPRHATGLSRWGATLRPSSVPLPGKQSLLFWLTEEEPELTVGNSAPPLCSRTAGPGFEPKYFGLQGPTNSQPHNVPPGCLGKKPGTVGIPRPRSQHPTEGGGKVPRELGERRWLTSAPGSGMEGSGGSNSEGQSGPCGQSRQTQSSAPDGKHSATWTDKPLR